MKVNRIYYTNLFSKKPILLDKYFYVIGIDPSGNMKSGKGHIGYCVLAYNNNEQYVVENGTIYLKDYTKLETALNDMLKIVDKYDAYWLGQSPLHHVVVENYIDYGKNATSMQEPETYYAVRYLKDHIEQEHQIPVSTPIASQHKGRFPDTILKNKGVQLNKLSSKHARDALRMCLYWYMFEEPKDK